MGEENGEKPTEMKSRKGARGENGEREGETRENLRC